MVEGTSQEGAGNPRASQFPLQMPGNLVASAQEENPQLSLLFFVARKPEVGAGIPCGQTPMGTQQMLLVSLLACHKEAASFGCSF